MILDPFLMLAAIIFLGAMAQWLGSLLRLPSILLLLLFGFLAGPVAGLIKPDELFGNALLPFVSLSVAMILFEGGLTLSFRELRGVGRVVFLLVTAGALITWILAAAAAHWFFKLDFEIAILLGSLLTVTGPTVVMPLLRHIRPTGSVAAILKWEGIVIDPIGALLAVSLFPLVAEGRYEKAVSHALWTIAKTLGSGGLLGFSAATLLVVALRRFWIPDRLHTICTTALVLVAYAGSNFIQHESGLVAVTLMGIALANQHFADLRHILEFKENLRVFLLSIMFVVLSARLSLAEMKGLGIETFGFLGALVLIIRPASVICSTIGSSLGWREKLFLSWMAPRGIVAAAVTSIFALALEELGYEQARLMVPIVFSTIVFTVLVYGLSGPVMARRLGLSDPNPQGILILSAGRFARELALVLKSCGVTILLVDSNRESIVAAQMAGLSAHFGSILTEESIEKMDLAGIGRTLALTPNDEVNTLAVQRFGAVFGRANLFQLPPKGSESGRSKIGSHLHGRLLFRGDATFGTIETLMNQNWTVRATKLTQDFGYKAFTEFHENRALPLMLLGDQNRLTVLCADEKIDAKPGQTVISLSPPAAERLSPGTTASNQPEAARLDNSETAKSP